jgi:hypothetical protein
VSGPVEVLRTLAAKHCGTETCDYCDAIDAVLSIAEDANQASDLLDGHDSPVVMKNTLANRVRELKTRLAKASGR